MAKKKREEAHGGHGWFVTEVAERDPVDVVEDLLDHGEPAGLPGGEVGLGGVAVDDGLGPEPDPE